MTSHKTIEGNEIKSIYLKQIFIKYLKKILVVISTILLINIAQWCCIQFIHLYCSKPGFWGMVENLLSLGSPICHFANNIQYNLSNYYVQLWISSGLGIIGLLSL